MEMYHTLSHTTWECKYHVVFISKYRKKGLYDQLRKNLGPVLKTLAAQKECQIEKGIYCPIMFAC
jgi:putative transposase